MIRFLQRLRTDQSGTTAVEYALIASLITIALVSAMGPVQQGLTSAFQSVASAMPKP